MKALQGQSAPLAVTTVAGWVLFLLAALVLFGWAFDLRVLERFVPESAAMKANSAAAMMIAATALLLRRHRVLPFLSIAVSLIGAFTLGEYYRGSNLGIDEFLIRDTHYFFYPGRMSQYTSIGLMLLGSSLLPMSSHLRLMRQLSRILGYLTGALGALAIVSHAYNTHAVDLIAPQSNVSVPTALGFLIGAVGVQYANPSEGIVRLLHADNAGGSMLRALLPAGILITVLLGFAVRDAQKDYRWENGFSLALVGLGVGACLVIGVTLIAADLERKDLARRESFNTFSRELIRAQDEERSRIAREIHDDYQQRVAMLGIDLEVLAENLGKDSEASARLNEIWNRVGELGSDLHSLSHRLHSSALDSLGLVAALMSLCAEFMDYHSIEVEFVEENVPHEIPREVSLCLFRVAQEALQNVRKHSGARIAEVRLEGLGDDVYLSISDPGTGFESASGAGHDGIGIRGMEERVRLVRGKFAIHSRPMEGTRVEAWVPFNLAVLNKV